MPCYYRSVSTIEIKDKETLMKALGRLGYEFKEFTLRGTDLVHRDFTIQVNGAESRVISNIGSTFAGRLKQAYGVEAAKKEMKKRGMRFKEIQDGKKIRLVVQG